ncbi:MAG: glycoside hydrolase family 43 protein [Nitrospiraceae bacterium]|nr:glycoside hydrolase family 43 protein [Nitrospiraceae bacterium]
MIFRTIAAFVLFLQATAVFSPEEACAEKAYTNPVLVDTLSSPHMGTMGIGDPAVIFFEGKYYLYPTGDNHGYDVYISSDLVHWKKGPRVFISAEPGVWAPHVLYNPPDRKFYLYYTVNRRVGVAVADKPDGTFRDLGALVEHAIDADMFLDEDGRYYLYYAAYPKFGIYVQPMESPVTIKGESILLIRPDEAWEKEGEPVTEAPWMLKHQGTYYLLYSGGGANTRYYAIGYATAKGPLGPFTKYPGNPMMKEGCGVYGPGHCSVIETPGGKLWIIYHQKKDGLKDWDRMICIDPLWFDDQGVLHGRATRGTPEPAPVTN